MEDNRINIEYEDEDVSKKIGRRNKLKYPTKKSYVLAAIAAFDEEKNDSGQDEISQSVLGKISEDHKKMEGLLEQILKLLEGKKKEERIDLFEDATQFFE